MPKSYHCIWSEKAHAWVCVGSDDDLTPADREGELVITGGSASDPTLPPIPDWYLQPNYGPAPAWAVPIDLNEDDRALWQIDTGDDDSSVVIEYVQMDDEDA